MSNLRYTPALLVGLVFLLAVLKSQHVLMLSWWYVLAPLWVPVLLMITLLACIGIVAGIVGIWRMQR